MGVAAGLAGVLRVDVLLVRIAFVVLTLAGGVGIAAYLLGWLASDEPAGEDPQPPSPGAVEATNRLALGFVVLGTLLLAREVGWWLGDAIVWPVLLAALGSAVLWARGDEEDRARWSHLGARLPGNPVEAILGGRVPLARVLLGGGLVTAGLGAFVAVNRSFVALGQLLLAGAVTIVGAALLVGPWVLRLARQAALERRARIRSEERAEVTAHLHDSVLQTLALIQRASSPREMAALARRQERELRRWLYGPPSGAADAAGDARVETAVNEIVGRVEADHAVTVEAVVVGDGPVDARVRALLDALSEALVNAAKHAQVPDVSAYLEVRPDAVEAWVRDRGVGFDPEAVPPDRRGIADSIRGRLERQGGSATIVSVPGEGTEVHLLVPTGERAP